MKPIFKRMLSGVLSAVMTVSSVPIVTAHAEKTQNHILTQCSPLQVMKERLL